MFFPKVSAHFTLSRSSDSPSWEEPTVLTLTLPSMMHSLSRATNYLQLHPLRPGVLFPRLVIHFDPHTVCGRSDIVRCQAQASRDLAASTCTLWGDHSCQIRKSRLASLRLRDPNGEKSPDIKPFPQFPHL